jgi:protein arginine N-methyltransferase 1
LKTLESGSRAVSRVVEKIVAAGIRQLIKLKRWLRRRPKVDELVYRSSNELGFEKLISHDVMLADKARVSAYEKAIAANVREGDVVVDLGTGTGILAFIAQRQSPGVVYGIDHGPLELAQALAEANGLDSIRFQRVHSRDFQPPEPVDVIIQEQIGNKVFEERMISNVTELRDRVLRTGGRILPNRIDVFFEPVEMVSREVVPLIWEHEIAGVDFSSARDFAAKQQRYPGIFQIEAGWAARLLSHPAPAISFDLETVELEEIPTRLDISRVAVVDGVQHGFLGYFTLRFDDVNSLTNDPFAPGERGICWPPMLLRTETRRRRQGETIKFEFTAEHLERPETWRWH